MSSQGALDFGAPAPPRGRWNGSRGTSNANARGNTKDREARRLWLLRSFASDVSTSSDPTCRCYRCGALLTESTLTVDRILPGCQGGKYTRENIRPACSKCNSVTGATTRSDDNPNGELL
jgi:5-methylcytosine-specific restriction endonuclease McrA